MHNIYVIAIVCAQKKPEKDESIFFARFIFPFFQKIFSKRYIYIYSIYLLTYLTFDCSTSLRSLWFKREKSGQLSK